MHLTNGRRARILCLTTLLVAPAVVPATSATQGTWLRRGKIEFQVLKDPGGRFTIEYPKRDWRVVPGGGSVLFTLAHSGNEAAVVVEYNRMDPPLMPEDITEMFSQVIELDEVKKRQPGASDFRPGLVTGPEGKQSQIDYTRPGMNGQERVRLVSMPRGADLYRIVCSAKAELFPKYEAIFSHIFETFRTRAAPLAPPHAGTSAPSNAADAGTTTPPRKIHDVPPRIPPSWGGAQRDANAVLTVLINVDGTTTVKDIVSSTDHDFLRECVSAIKLWRYEPARRNDVPVAFASTLTCRVGAGRSPL
jgi:hypothetical protein